MNPVAAHLGRREVAPGVALARDVTGAGGTAMTISKPTRAAARCAKRDTTTYIRLPIYEESVE
jgi:hypothetical protein